MNRRVAMVALLGLFVSMEAADAVAQSRAAPRRLALLEWADEAQSRVGAAQFSAELAKLGWIEGANLASTRFYLNGDAARYEPLAEKMVALRPDALVVTTTRGAVALKRLTTAIPVVFMGLPDPVGAGLVETIQRPGGNFTGVAASISGADMLGKTLQLFAEVLPQMTRVVVTFNPSEPESAKVPARIREYASAHGIQVQELPLRNESDIDTAFWEMRRARPDAVYLSANAVTMSNRQAICDRLAAARIPSISNYTQVVEAGCLLGYLTLVSEYQRGGAELLDRILRGASPADLPVRFPSRYEFVINLKAARAIGLPIPQPIQARADRLIE